MSIACEFCNDIVSISLYPQHLRRCRIMHMFNENDDDDDSYDDNIIERHIRSGHQVYRSNIRSFLETHHSPPERRGVVMRQRQTQQRQTQQQPSYEDNMRLMEMMGGRVAVGVKDINAVSSIIKLGDDDVDASCAICLENFCENAKAIRRLSRCQHMFCHGCIVKWLNISKTCPMCKTDLSEKIDLMS